MQMMEKATTQLNEIQRKLNFEDCDNPTFKEKMGLGRVALMASVLGFLWGFSLILFLHIYLFLSEQQQEEEHFRVVLGWQFCAYLNALCTFHLLEFFITAIFNPTQVTADSFLINHSTAYTAAALSSWTEFALHVCFFPSYNSRYASYCGMGIVLLGQILRSLAMATAGESFNHLIQMAKKPNHKLITHGVYRYLRHPSYVGFYYWCIGCQIVLGNYLHAVLFSVVAWLFFARRIAFEEESLCKFFPHYPEYVSRTYMGIPFMRTKVDTSQVLKKKNQ